MIPARHLWWCKMLEAVQQIPVRKGCPEGLNWGGMAEAPEAAMSSGSRSCLGLWDQKGGRRLHQQLCVVHQ